MNVDSGRHQRKRRHGRALPFLKLSNAFGLDFGEAPLRYASERESWMSGKDKSPSGEQRSSALWGTGNRGGNPDAPATTEP
jgi:hypothetical protein